MNTSIIVTNLYKDPEGVYIGRGGRGVEASPLANPFPLSSTLTRAESITKYQTWLNEKLTNPFSPQSLEIKRLRLLWQTKGELKLKCFCSPLACHGDVIKAIIEAYPNVDSL